MRIAVYPGSFDPITKGHLDIIERAAQIFDRVIVAVAVNSSKQPLFTMGERVEMIRASCSHIRHVEVGSFSGLLIDFVRQNEAHVIIRGLRAVSDFENEFKMALVNKKLKPDVETVFLTSQAEYTFLSSSIVKEVAKLGGAVDHFLPPVVIARLKEKFQVLGSKGER